MRVVVAMSFGWMLGCAPDVAVESGTMGGTGGANTTGVDAEASSSGVMSGVGGTNSSASESDVGDAAGFIDETEGTADCDVWAQNCASDEKCVPWANDGGNAWNVTHCVPIMGAGQAGDACTVDGTVLSRVDTCGAASMCWFVDPDTDEGTCVAFCVGSENAPLCEDPRTTCWINAEGVLNLCLPICDPLEQDCPGTGVCVNVPDGFVCALDASGDAGAFGDPCEAVNVCDPGLLCASALLVPGCVGGHGCCSPFCDVEEAAHCPGAGQECLPLFEPGQARPGNENVGVCGVPT